MELTEKSTASGLLSEETFAVAVAVAVSDDEVEDALECDFSVMAISS